MDDRKIVLGTQSSCWSVILSYMLYFWPKKKVRHHLKMKIDQVVSESWCGQHPAQHTAWGCTAHCCQFVSAVRLHMLFVSFHEKKTTHEGLSSPAHDHEIHKQWWWVGPRYSMFPSSSRGRSSHHSLPPFLSFPFSSSFLPRYVLCCDQRAGRERVCDEASLSLFTQSYVNVGPAQNNLQYC